MPSDAPRRVSSSWLAAVVCLALWPAAIAAEPPTPDESDEPVVQTDATSPDPDVAPSAAEDATNDADDTAAPDDETESAAEPTEMSDDAAADPDAETADPDEQAPSALDADSAAPAEKLKSQDAEGKHPAALRNLAAALDSIRPGHTTADQLHAQWGLPRRSEKFTQGLREAYDLASGDRVRVIIRQDVVDSLSAQLDDPIAAKQLAKQLDLDFEGVDVFDDQAHLVGLAYPERGMLCAFEPDANPPRVAQVVVEPLDAQLFVARAETRLPSRYADCASDLKRALELTPNHARAHNLHAQLMLNEGDLEKALRSARKASELEPREWDFRLTLARVLAESGDYQQAIAQLRDVVEQAAAGSLAAAQTHCQLGDCIAASGDHAQAIKQHLKAIELARALVAGPRIGQHRAALELLVDAHLAVAHDVGWGHWQQKPATVAKWLEHAKAQVDVIAAGGENLSELRLRVHERALSALSGIDKPEDVTPWIDSVQELATKVLEASQDAAYKAHVAWHLGLALADAADIEATRGRAEQSVALGKSALAQLEAGRQAGDQLPAHDYLLGRVSYRVGAALAIQKSEHRKAVVWYDRAVPLLESPVPATIVNEGKHGEMFVSMAVTYWEIKNRREALRLTNQGVQMMETAVRDGQLPKPALAIPYANLATMHEQLGNAQEAKKFAAMAVRQQEFAPSTKPR